MLLNIIASEPSLGEIILQNFDVKTTININTTCKLLNSMTKNVTYNHYIDHTKIDIPLKFEEIAKKKTYDSCSKDEYNTITQDLATNITHENENEIVDELVSQYYYYMFSYHQASGLESDVYECIARKYKEFLTTTLGVILNDDTD